MALLVAGSVAYDAIETPFGKVDRTLGGAASYLAVAASFFTPVQLAAVVGEDFASADAAIFRRRHIDISGLERAPGKTFFWAGRYSENMNQRTTLATELNVFANFQPKLPAAYRDARYVFLGNIDPTLQRSVLAQVRRRPRLVGLDTMNYWIERTPAELKKTLQQTDALVINDDEARQLSGEYNLLRAARAILKMGPRILIIKRGEHGALMFGSASMFSVPAFPLEEVRDPTGAGDAFAAGFIGYLANAGRIDEHALRRAMVYGSVMGSFVVEQFGLARLHSLTRREIEQRAKFFLKLTRFRL